MRYVWVVTIVLAGALVGCTGDEPNTPSSKAAKPPADQTWPQFRGPTGDGVAAATAAVVADLDPAKHMAWRTPLAAAGNSSPIVWGDRIFLTGEGLGILAFDRSTGKPLWDTALTAPLASGAADEEDHEPSEYGTASATACTDGERVYAFFGSGVIGCVDFTGKQVWAKRLVDHPANTFGLAASPIVHNGVVIQLIDQEPNDDGDEPVYTSFIVGLNAADGAELWRQPRPVYSSWAGPLLVRHGARESIVTCASPWVISYDPATGAERWRAGGLEGDVAATPIASDGRVYAFSDPSGSVLAIRLGGGGDVTQTHVQWTFDEDLPDVASALTDGQRLIQISDMNDARGIDATTGEPLWRTELSNTVYASPVLVAARMYVIDTEGQLSRIEPSTGAVEHTVELGETVNASPAVVGDFLYIRGAKTLMCLGGGK